MRASQRGIHRAEICPGVNLRLPVAINIYLVHLADIDDNRSTGAISSETVATTTNPGSNPIVLAPSNSEADFIRVVRLDDRRWIPLVSSVPDLARIRVLAIGWQYEMRLGRQAIGKRIQR